MIQFEANKLFTIRYTPNPHALFWQGVLLTSQRRATKVRGVSLGGVYVRSLGAISLLLSNPRKWRTRIDRKEIPLHSHSARLTLPLTQQIPLPTSTRGFPLIEFWTLPRYEEHDTFANIRCMIRDPLNVTSNER